MSAPTIDDVTATETTEVASTPATEEVNIESFSQSFDKLLKSKAKDRSSLADSAVAEYASLEGRGNKSAARRIVDKAVDDSIRSGDIATAQLIIISVRDKLVTTKPATGRKPKNPTEAAVETVATIGIAYNLALANEAKGKNVDPDWQEKASALVTNEAVERANTYVAWLNSGQEGDEPKISEIEKSAARISLGRGPKGQGRKPKTQAEKDAAAAAKAAADSTTPVGNGDPISDEAGTLSS